MINSAEYGKKAGEPLADKENIGREYVTLDDLTERDMAKNDPALFLQLHKPPVLIDEVQYAPELFTYIKIHIDKNHNPGDFWLTGSQIFRLMQGVQESLAVCICRPCRIGKLSEPHACRLRRIWRGSLKSEIRYILCITEQFSAFDKDNLIVPIRMI